MEKGNMDALKDRLRKETVRKLKALPKAYREESDRKICGRILSLPEYQEAGTLFTFVGTKDEIDTMSLIKDALKAGKRVGVPRSGDGGVMAVYAITGEEDLKPGRFGILEPVEAAELIPIEEIDFCVIPCLACDLKGNRLGHGGGYYDRYLSRRRMATVVVCYHELVLPEVPVMEHDVPVDRVVTEQVVVELRTQS
jgi:5-formyltetrahydrofolate cyclo-ligase